MKSKAIPILRFITSVIFLTASTLIWADVEQHIYYEKNSDGTRYVTGAMPNSDGSLIIPSQVKDNDKTYDVTGIGSGAFYKNIELKSVSIPNSVTFIGDHAFYGCSNLTSISIPNSVTFIGNWAFNGCSSLTSLKVKDGNPMYDSRNNCNAIIESSTNTLFAGCKTTTIPNGVTSIGLGAFWLCSGLTSIIIPNGVTSIGEEAFRDCNNLASIVIPNSVTSIGKAAFLNCKGLKSVTCYADKVPSAEYTTFLEASIGSATLYVPASALYDYKHTSPWDCFGKFLIIYTPAYLVGDANGNGEVEIGDVTSVLTLMATPEATGYNNQAADANGNGVIEIGDVPTILTIMANDSE